MALEAAITSQDLSRQEIDQVKEMTQQLGGFGYAWQAADRSLQRSREDLSALPDSQARDAFLMATSQAFPFMVSEVELLPITV